MLDGYEAQANEMFDQSGGHAGVRGGLDFGPADGEREKSYALAETLHSSLDQLSRSLTSMIDEVNTLSSHPSTSSQPVSSSSLSAATILDPTNPDSSASSTNKEDESEADPITQISQILNAHLTSLQWIDGATGGMKEKVVELERKMVEVNGGGNPGGKVGRRALELGGGAGNGGGGQLGGSSSGGRYGLGRR
jgi:nuclear pore complex protein Nup62